MCKINFVTNKQFSQAVQTMKQKDSKFNVIIYPIEYSLYTALNTQNIDEPNTKKFFNILKQKLNEDYVYGEEIVNITTSPFILNTKYIYIFRSLPTFSEANKIKYTLPLYVIFFNIQMNNITQERKIPISLILSSLVNINFYNYLKDIIKNYTSLDMYNFYIYKKDINFICSNTCYINDVSNISNNVKNLHVIL